MWRLVSRSLVLCAALLSCAIAVSPVHAQTLEQVRERDYLICGAVGPLAGFAQQDSEGRWTGFDIDICRAIAAAALGDPNKLEFRALSGRSRFAPLQIGQVDVIVRNAPWSFGRDAMFGARYVTPTFFDGLAFMVPQELGLVSAYELDNLSICLVEGGEELTRLREFFFQNQASYREVLYQDLADLRIAYRAGYCDIVAAAGRDLHAMRLELPDPSAHRILPERISKEVIGPVVRDDVPQWIDLVRWTIFTLINAEELGLTALNTDSLSGTRTDALRKLLGLSEDFGAGLDLEPDFMTDIIRAVGNYGEIYERNFGPQNGAALLRGQNSLWSNGGLIYAPPIR
ncbi:amino acid ABC transporter substrate-binding protein [Devosia pacifica]|uniref:Amino acid ABC transporter substrate-binding protein n=1 Tax=Devosia pacifica TaxID=1335967 RepID=A0A918RTY9_9HYPH|nr:transporter substrate-binding domain-containing protein [Devosia pacifica]GHA10352.1 amino acid ABC transporter substrate-binding protein [Devosia pacifica]